MFSIILYQPEIPPNTGNIIRLCANTQCQLHLIQPLGFVLDDKHLRRAGLDYHALTQIQIHDNLAQCLVSLNASRVFALSAKGKTLFTTPRFEPNDAFLFGPETRGLSPDILDGFAPHRQLRLPQHTQNRSLNLSNAVAVMVYEAWRQNDFS